MVKFISHYYVMENDTLVVQRSEYRQWAFTLRRTNLKKGLPKKETYQTFIESLCHRNDSYLSNYCFEQTGGLHMHGIVDIPHTVPLQLFRVRGWKMHMEEIWNIDGWMTYMAKEQLIELYEHPLRRSLFKDHVDTATLADAPSAPLLTEVSGSICL